MQTQKHPFFGKYEVLDQLGEGGFGRVVKARHRFLGREFAVKQLAPGLVSSEADYTRFIREAHAMGQLDHPNIVRVYDADVEGGFPYIAMEYVEGEDVEKLIAGGGPLPIGEVVRLGREVASALAHMHEHGIVHRDVKSSNIMRRAMDGSFFLTDFGMALQEGTSRITTELMGSREFMSPEQINGLAVPQTDQYGLGVVLYEALTGQKPFTAEGTHEAALMPLLQRILHEAAPRVSALRPGVPEWLTEVVARCLMKEPEERYPSMQAMEHALRSEPPARSRPSPPPMAAEPPPSAPPPVLPAPVSGRVAPPREHVRIRESMPLPPRLNMPTRPPAGSPSRPTAAHREVAARDGPRRLPPLAWALLLLLLAVVGYFALANRASDEEQQANDTARSEPPGPGRVGETAASEGGETDYAVGEDREVAVPEEVGVPEEVDLPEEGAPFPSREPAAADEQPAALPSNPVTISPDEARAVVDSYLESGAGGDSADLLGMYADRVNYYGRGTMSRTAVLEDKSYYFRQWPERSYERLADVVVEQTAEGAKLRFNYAFEVEDDGQGVRGEGWAELTLRRDGGELRIVGENGGVRTRRTF